MRALTSLLLLFLSSGFIALARDPRSASRRPRGAIIAL